MNDETAIAELRAELARTRAQLRVLADRQEILDCSHRFCRGVNRRDRELLRSAFHPDAIDDHGFYCGGIDGFLDWIDTVYDDIAQTQHYVSNQSVELDGDGAHAEQYWLVVNVRRAGGEVIIRGGRYIDRFERRGGRWAIAARVCFTEWNGATQKIDFPPEVQAMLAQSGIAALDRTDLSYARPLAITRAHTSARPHAGGAART
ncbi:MAG: nuclear transport factor 2 family protein [Gammaproteobacteria bacterium]